MTQPDEHTFEDLTPDEQAQMDRLTAAGATLVRTVMTDGIYRIAVSRSTPGEYDVKPLEVTDVSGSSRLGVLTKAADMVEAAARAE